MTVTKLLNRTGEHLCCRLVANLFRYLHAKDQCDNVVEKTIRHILWLTMKREQEV